MSTNGAEASGATVAAGPHACTATASLARTPDPATRAERLAGLLAESELDALIVGDLVRPGDSGPQAIANLRWLTGFSGTSGVCLLGAEERLFLTDFRYVERAKREVGGEFERITVDRQLVPDLAGRLRGRVGYDDANTSVRNLRLLEEGTPDGAELVPAAGLVERLRRRKDETELQAIAEAARLADEVYEWLCEHGFVGRTEREVQLAAEQRMRELGAEGAAFPTIVAAGENSALPHHESSAEEIRAAGAVLIDMGTIVDGYCSDCTRTFFVGEPCEDAREVYELVLAAQIEALGVVRAEAAGRDVDAVARERIAEAGHGERFGHGLGHGVGLEVHEAPRLSQRSDDVLASGEVVTVEPGVYLPDEFGVRIEDLVVVGGDGCRILTSVSKELRVVG